MVFFSLVDATMPYCYTFTMAVDLKMISDGAFKNFRSGVKDGDAL